MESIAVIILTKNNFEVIKKCLDSFKNINTYNNIKFYIGDTGSTDEQYEQLVSFCNEFKYDKEILKFNYYNFAKNHNWIIENRVKENFILFCNDDIELINDAVLLLKENWEDGLGTVGCKLLYLNNTIQHGGHVHIKNHNQVDVSHKHLQQPNKKLDTEYNVGNTFAFALTKKDVYLSVGGLNSIYKKCFEDVEFCLSCSKENLKHKFVGLAECYHAESISRKKLDSTIDMNDVIRIKKQLKKFYGTVEKIN